MFRPMRPKPLMPTFTAMKSNPPQLLRDIDVMDREPSGGSQSDPMVISISYPSGSLRNAE
jgi:hypothetical protein